MLTDLMQNSTVRQNRKVCTFRCKQLTSALQQLRRTLFNESWQLKAAWNLNVQKLVQWKLKARI